MFAESIDEDDGVDSAQAMALFTALSQLEGFLVLEKDSKSSVLFFLVVVFCLELLPLAACDRSFLCAARI